MTFEKLLKNKYILLDGGFGTELIKKGLLPHEDTVNAVFDHPEWVKEIHKAYIDAGSNIIFADTFGANAFKLEGSEHTVSECINEAISLAKEAARGTETLVALDVSTTGKLIWSVNQSVYTDLSINPQFEWRHLFETRQEAEKVYQERLQLYKLQKGPGIRIDERDTYTFIYKNGKLVVDLFLESAEVGTVKDIGNLYLNNI